MFFLNDFLAKIKPKYSDNAVDRLNYFWTCGILALLSLTIGLYQFGGNPIKCWTPVEFTGFWDQYVLDYCFVENTYFVPQNASNLPVKHIDRTKAEISYYQWIPFVLAFQAILFFVPAAFWSMLNTQSGINVEKLVGMGRDTKNVNPKSRTDNVVLIADHLNKSVDMQRDFGGKGNPFSVALRFGKRQGFYVSMLYIITKVLFVVNVIGQFFLLNKFLSPNYHWWGPGILSDLANGREWESSGHFPRVTFCDFKIRRLGNLHNYTVQCVLWINMLNEKIFLFLWFWMVVVALLTVLDLVYWLFVALAPGNNHSFIHKYLRVRNLISRQQPKDLRDNSLRFTKDLRPDGIFVLRLMSHNVGDLITTDVVERLWSNFQQRQGIQIEPPAGLEESATIRVNPLADHTDQSIPPAYSTMPHDASGVTYPSLPPAEEEPPLEEKQPIVSEE